MKMWKKIPAPLLTVLMMAVLSVTIAFRSAPRIAETTQDAAINNQQALTYMGKVVSVDPSGASLSVRGDDGFKTFQTLPGMVKDVDAGDGVKIYWARDDGGLKAIRVRVMEKARHGSQAQQIREERARARRQEAEEKAASRARNLP